MSEDTGVVLTVRHKRVLARDVVRANEELGLRRVSSAHCLGGIGRAKAKNKLSVRLPQGPYKTRPASPLSRINRGLLAAASEELLLVNSLGSPDVRTGRPSPLAEVVSGMRLELLDRSISVDDLPSSSRSVGSFEDIRENFKLTNARLEDCLSRFRFMSSSDKVEQASGVDRSLTLEVTDQSEIGNTDLEDTEATQSEELDSGSETNEDTDEVFTEEVVNNPLIDGQVLEREVAVEVVAPQVVNLVVAEGAELNVNMAAVDLAIVPVFNGTGNLKKFLILAQEALDRQVENNDKVLMFKAIKLQKLDDKAFDLGQAALTFADLKKILLNRFIPTTSLEDVDDQIVKIQFMHRSESLDDYVDRLTKLGEQYKEILLGEDVAEPSAQKLTDIKLIKNFIAGLDDQTRHIMNAGVYTTFVEAAEAAKKMWHLEETQLRRRGGQRGVPEVKIPQIPQGSFTVNASQIPLYQVPHVSYPDPRISYQAPHIVYQDPRFGYQVPQMSYQEPQFIQHRGGVGNNNNSNNNGQNNMSRGGNQGNNSGNKGFQRNNAQGYDNQNSRNRSGYTNNQRYIPRNNANGNNWNNFSNGGQQNSKSNTFANQPFRENSNMGRNINYRDDRNDGSRGFQAQPKPVPAIEYRGASQPSSVDDLVNSMSNLNVASRESLPQGMRNMAVSAMSGNSTAVKNNYVHQCDLVENTEVKNNTNDGCKKGGTLRPVLEVNESEDLPNKLVLQLDATINKFSNLILDTGAGGCLLKLNALKNGTVIDTSETFFLSGINQGKPVETLGKVTVKIVLKDGIEIHQPFNVVPNDFPVETGLIGRDFLKMFNADISYKNGKISIYYTDKDFVTLPMSVGNSNCLLIAARTEMLVKIEVPYKEDMVSVAQELQPRVFSGNCIVSPVDNQAYISVMNANDSDVILEKSPSFVPLRQFNVLLTLKTKRDSTQEPAQKPVERWDLVKEIVEKGLDENLNLEEKTMVLDIVEEYSDVFYLEGEPLSVAKDYEHVISVYANTVPVYLRPYKVPQTQKKLVEEEVAKLLRDGIVRHSVSPWSSPVILIPKKKTSPDAEQKYRLCVDFRKLNESTIPDRYPLGNIDEILEQLGHSRYFSTLDLTSSFHQLALAESSKEKTAFTVNHNHLEYNRVPYGLRNSPSTFQRYLNHVLTGLNGVKCLVYLDDIIIYGRSLQDHNNRLAEVFEALRENNLKLQTNKCQFLRKEISYLGHVVSEQGVATNPSKVSAIVEMPRPKNAKELKSFIAMVNFFRNFISGFSAIVDPMNNLLRKGVPFVWSELCEKSFVFLKQCLVSAPILAYPDFTKTFYLTTDASNKCLGSILSQIHEGRERAIAYGSRKLNDAEKNYNTTERELLAIVWAIQCFRHLLYGRHFVVYSDHKPLLGDSKVPSLRILKYKIKLADYCYDLRFISGKSNVISDCLSRIDHVLAITRAQTNRQNKGIDIEDEVQEKKDRKKNSASARPMTAGEISDALQAGPSRMLNDKSKYISGIKIVTDPKERIKLIEDSHNSLVGGHAGVYRTFKFLREKYQWPHLMMDVAKYIKNCKKCQINKHIISTKVPMAITSTSEEVFSKVYLDIVGPLNTSARGNKYILTMIDDLSRYTMAQPMVSQDAETVARTLFDHFISVVGSPKIYVTDLGSNFTSKLFASLCKLLKITKLNSAAYHAQSNLVEAFHRPLGEYLRNYCQKEPDNWDLYVSAATFSYNCHEHKSLKYTPFEMLFGRKPNIPSFYKTSLQPIYNQQDFVLDLRYKLHRMHLDARRNLVEAKLKSKKYYDTNVKPFVVEKGDMVWLKDETRVGKLAPLRKGPYEIVEVISPENSLVKIKNKNKVVHNNRLSKYTQEENEGSDLDIGSSDDEEEE